MKKRFLPVFLALILCMGLVAPALAADVPAPPKVTVSGLEGEVPGESRDFTLRDFEIEVVSSSRFIEIHTVFTRSEETRTVSVEEAPILTLGTSIDVDGLRPYQYGEAYTTAEIRAWSDPDGDGVYDQQLFLFYGNDPDNIAMVRFYQPGPFTFYAVDVGEKRPVYTDAVYALGRDGLTSQPYDEGLTERAQLSAEFLTSLFGPDTLIQLTVKLTQPSGKPGEDWEPQDYYFHIPAGQIVFTDVPEWCAPAVDWAVKQKITDGTGAGKFSPDDACKQGEILTFLWRAAGKPESEAEAPIPVTGDEWYAGALRWAAEKGMIGEGFELDAPCTRASAVTYIWQAFDKPEAQAGGFADVSADVDCAEAVGWAAANGITNGYANGDGTFSFRPDNTCSRGEIVTFLHRAYVPEVRLPVA